MRLSSKVLAVLVAVVGLGLAGPVRAQAPAPAGEEQTFKQVKLTEAHIKGFIGAQRDMAALAEKQGGAAGDQPDPKVQAELDAIAKKHGFQDFVDFDDVAFNISMVISGLDPQTGAFTDPVTSIKKEMADIEADKTIPEKDRKQMLEELAEALKHTPSLQYPENIEVVKRHRADIEQVLQ